MSNKKHPKLVWNIHEADTCVGDLYVLVKQDTKGGWYWIINNNGERECENDISLRTFREATADVQMVVEDILNRKPQ